MRWERVTKTAVFLMALILSVSAVAEEVKLIKLNYRSASEIRKWFDENFPTLTAKKALMVDSKSNSILLRVKKPSPGEPNTSEIEEMIKALDIPLSEVEVILRLVVASKKEGHGETPQEISELVSALQPIFKFRSYRVISTSVLSCEEGSPASIDSAGYSISFIPRVGKESIKLEEFQVFTTPPTTSEQLRAALGKKKPKEGRVYLRGTTSIRDGKTRVIGIGGISLDGDKTLMVVITVRRIKLERFKRQ
ncbi:hypothetical protein J7M22_06565 [Candidatus Poribacteria bacterium]|nr:hypothetical protein [Candidatus Poribacteria bacterium]